MTFYRFIKQQGLFPFYNLGFIFYSRKNGKKNSFSCAQVIGIYGTFLLKSIIYNLKLL